MRGTKALRFVLLGLVLCCGQHISYAQEQNESTTENHNPKADRQSDAAKPGAERQMHPYRAEFLITELEEGKKLNSRHYSMLLNAGGWTQIRIGTRVPSGPDAPGQFLDVGTNINCR